MPFAQIPGFPGKLFVPEKQHDYAKKHPCKDCFSCHHCSDDRCRVCRDEKGGQKKSAEKS
jgi:hypothetical protein